MICGNCRTTIPDESAFCLRCGTRLMAPQRLLPVNGGKAQPGPEGPPALERAARAAAPRLAARPGGKEAYALSFKPLADERLRYRVSRWLCEVAPAHQISEVQQGLTAGGFATFLALTPAEAEVACQRLEALGAHPALWHLAPATLAQMLLPERARPAKAEWSLRKKFAMAGIGLLIFLVFSVISWNRYQAATLRAAQPAGAPGAGARP